MEVKNLRSVNHLSHSTTIPPFTPLFVESLPAGLIFPDMSTHRVYIESVQLSLLGDQLYNIGKPNQTFLKNGVLTPVPVGVYYGDDLQTLVGGYTFNTILRKITNIGAILD